MTGAAKRPKTKAVESFIHEEAKRRNIPTAEMQSLYEREAAAKPVTLSYPRATPLEPGHRRERNRDLDPQLVWRGKDEQDWSDLVVHAPPLYIQEKIHPKVIIEDLRRQTQRRRDEADDAPDLFADFNGLPDTEARLEFYQHDQNWSNRMILGDSLQVMASLAEREGLRGQVQCIYIDPPYGIRFNSNWQVSTRSSDMKDGRRDQISREPEQIKAFRDTWKDGVHSYLTYLRDRLTVARDLLHESGSVFVQIGDENVHRVRSLMDEIFGEGNFCAVIDFKKTGGQSSTILPSVFDSIVWYAKDIDAVKFRGLFSRKVPGEEGATNFDWIEMQGFYRRKMSSKEFNEVRILGKSDYPILQPYPLFSDGKSEKDQPFEWRGSSFSPSSGSHWKTTAEGLRRLASSDRLVAQGKTLRFVNYLTDYPVTPLINSWLDTQISGYNEKRVFVVQTLPLVVQRCVLMTSDPGDLVLDPTCGSGTTAYVAEQWGRRWITIDTSRVALALARARIMGARYSYYLLADSEDGRRKEAEITGKVPVDGPTYGDLRQGFVYERVPHITLKSIANNAEIDVIWEQMQPAVEHALVELNTALRDHPMPFKVTTGGRAGQTVDFTAPAGATVKLPSGEDAPANGLLEWEVPHQFPDDWPEAVRNPLDAFWEARLARQKAIDESIARAADVELLYDKPYEDRSKVRVAGPFTVESLSPHRVMPSDEYEAAEEIDAAEGARRRKPKLPYERDGEAEFADIVIEHLRTAGVQQRHKEDRINFTSLAPWPGEYIGAEGRFMEGEREKRAAILIGPEYGTISRPDLIAAAREAAEAGFDVLIACGFAFDAHASEFSRLGPLPVLRARMNPDLHMADELKNTGAGNLFVVFGEPDVEVGETAEGEIQVRIKGVDVFDPQTGEVRSGGTDDIAAWFIDTDYDEESFFVRHAYFLGAHDPYKALKTTLKAEIDEEAWATLYRDVSRPFPKPSTGRFAVKVINHLGDEVMKVFAVA